MVGLLVSRRSCFTPRSYKIWAPIPYSLRSGANPSFTFASTVSYPCSCSSYAFNLLMRPIPRPSWRIYKRIPRSSAAICFMALSNCSPQSHRLEPNTSPVRHSECTRHSTGSPSEISPIVSATWCSPFNLFT